MGPHTTGGQPEDAPKERPKQPTLEDLARALRERRQVHEIWVVYCKKQMEHSLCPGPDRRVIAPQVHAWIDLEMQDSGVDGLTEAFENLKERVNSWSVVKMMTDYKLSTEYEIKEPAFRKEMMKRMKPLAAMGSPLSSDRPANLAPQTGTEPRLLGGVVDVFVKDFPPIGRRGDMSSDSSASYPFRLCGDDWSMDLTCNKHWVKLYLCYKGTKPSVDRITSVRFRRGENEAPLQYVFEPKQAIDAMFRAD